MKITKKQLEKLISEAVKEQLKEASNDRWWYNLEEEMGKLYYNYTKNTSATPTEFFEFVKNWASEGAAEEAYKTAPRWPEVPTKVTASGSL